jgi:hypothetical protein
VLPMQPLRPLPAGAASREARVKRMFRATVLKTRKHQRDWPAFDRDRLERQDDRHPGLAATEFLKAKAKRLRNLPRNLSARIALCLHKVDTLQE